MFNLFIWIFCLFCILFGGFLDWDLCIYWGYFLYNIKIYIDWELLLKFKVYFYEINNKCEYFGINNLKIYIYYNCVRLLKICKMIILLYKIYIN